MNIIPNSTIVLLSGVPLAPGNEDTLYFSSMANRHDYFISKKVLQVDRATYNRVSDNECKIECPFNIVYSVNYMMFKNTSFENKWFYAFVTDVEYVSNNCVKIRYEIDVIQTWFQQIFFKQCFVEREHIINDAVGNNLVPENIEYGDYVIYSQNDDTIFPSTEIIDDYYFKNDGANGSSWAIFILSEYKTDGEQPKATHFGNIFSGVETLVSQTVDGAAFILHELTEKNKQDGVICVYMAPTTFTKEVSGGNPYEQTIPYNFSTVGGYAPKNNKLFTYPYNFLMVTNYRGNSAEYRFENFRDNKTSGENYAKFEITGSVLPDSEFLCTPKNYKGVGLNYNEAISLSGLPTCSYSTDFYKAWLAQNKNNSVFSVASSAITGALSGMNTGFPAISGISAATSSANAIMNIMKQTTNAKAQPNHVQGNQTSNIMYTDNKFHFGFFRMNIQGQFARKIDKFFDMYGYQTNEVKLPNISNRPQWNYVLTRNAGFTGNIPAKHMTEINNRFNSGIRFWKNPENVGNYSLENGGQS